MSKISPHISFEALSTIIRIYGYNTLFRKRIDWSLVEFILSNFTNILQIIFGPILSYYAIISGGVKILVKNAFPFIPGKILPNSRKTLINGQANRLTGTQTDEWTEGRATDRHVFSGPFKQGSN